MVTLTLRLPDTPRGRRVDYAGAALLCLAIVSVILLCSGGSYSGPDWVAPVLAAVAVAAMAGWLFAARRTADPIIPLSLFRTPHSRFPRRSAS